jgi:hypothetical protein
MPPYVRTETPCAWHARLSRASLVLYVSGLRETSRSLLYIDYRYIILV